ncbi:hypothetical protein XMM354_002225 [Aliiroseovarius sp. xm-m-354]|nr:hypothetical protein [Aliiroseovarius sp. xm-m-354]NRQ05209.1 hypothetical protein [Aliiroseovarius sp. xm-m-309]
MCVKFIPKRFNPPPFSCFKYLGVSLEEARGSAPPAQRPHSYQLDGPKYLRRS